MGLCRHPRSQELHHPQLSWPLPGLVEENEEVTLEKGGGSTPRPLSRAARAHVCHLLDYLGHEVGLLGGAGLYLGRKSAGRAGWPGLAGPQGHRGRNLGRGGRLRGRHSVPWQRVSHVSVGSRRQREGLRPAQTRWESRRGRVHILGLGQFRSGSCAAPLHAA